MKYLKKYEEINKGEPQIGDYVIIDNTDYPAVSDYIKNNVGQLININRDYGILSYEVQHINRPESLKKYFNERLKFRRYKREDIKYWSKDKNELEVILNTNKYNL